jgi:ADP-ribosylglycohydrolase
MIAGEGLQGRFFSFTTVYLFIGEYKYWFMTPHDEIDLDSTEDDYVLNRARLYRDRRDFLIQPGDTGRREDYPGAPRQASASNLPKSLQGATQVTAKANPIDDEMTDVLDRCRGSMVGLAVGNLMGVCQEGMSRHQLLCRYPGGIREIEALPGYPDDDDLAQAVILADACLAADHLEVEDLARRFWAWGEENGLGMGGLTRRALTHFGGALPQQARGTETRPRQPEGCPAHSAAREAWEESGRCAAGNGAVMRCAPVAVRWMHSELALVLNTVVSAVATHYDPRCVWSSVVVNLCIAALLRGSRLGAEDLLSRAGSAIENVSAVLVAFGVAGHSAGVPRRVRQAMDLGAAVDPAGLQLDGGTIGYTLKTMRVALWCAWHAEDFEEALIDVVSEGGDTDTNGAVAGAVLGARFGAAAIPRRWRERTTKLRHGRTPLEEWADRLSEAANPA